MSRAKDRKRASERRRGLTNGRGATNGLTNGLRTGLTNGAGRVNGTGRVNGVGRTNGLGRVNGLASPRGATNGTGVINGLVNGTFRRGLRANRFGVITHKDLRLGLSMVVLFLLLLGPFYVLLSTPGPTPPTRISPDGNLGDWAAANVAFIEDAVASPNQDIRLARYSAFAENGYLSFAVTVFGVALGDNAGLDAFYVFIDSDNRSTTGYEAREIGADYMVSVTGGDNSVSSSVLYEYASGSDRTNWSAWDRLQTVPAGASAASLEVQLPPNAADIPSTAQILLHASDFDGNETSSRVHFGLSLRALLVSQSAATAVVASSGQVFAALTFTGYGGPVDVASLQLRTVRGPSSATLAGLSDVAVAAGVPITRVVAVTFAGGDAGQYLVATLDPRDVEVGVPVTVEGPDIVAYLGTAPADHRADGSFVDWTGGFGTDTTTVADRNVDIEQYAANRTGSTAFVYADVAGRVFGGTATPERIVRPTGGGGGGSPSPPGPRPAKRGEDIFRAYIDVDQALPNGVSVLGVRADFLVEIRGMHGRVTGTRAYEWAAGQWTSSTRSVTVANDRTRFEAGLDLSGVATGQMAMAFEATDWADIVDTTDIYTFLDVPVGGGTRGAPILAPLPSAHTEAADAQSLANGDAVLDGNCATTGSEYAGAGSFSNPFIRGRVGTSGSYLFVCVDVASDVTDDPNDRGIVRFDAHPDGGTTPQVDNREFAVLLSGGLMSSKGDGVAWVPCLSACDRGNEAAGGFIGGHRAYEFKIRFADVWGTDTPSAGQVAGFGVVVVDASGPTTYTWGSNSPPGDPSSDSGGHILVPEFHEILVPIAVVGIIYFVARRRRRATDP